LTTQSLERTAYSVRDVHEALGISASTFWKYVKLGQIKVIAFGGRTVVPATEFRRLSEEGVGSKSGRGAYRLRRNKAEAR
jgi:predicted site-specific integrase-resolvase